MSRRPEGTCSPMTESAEPTRPSSQSDADRVQAITAAVYGGSKTRNPEEDVRFLLGLLRRVMQQCDGDCHAENERCIGCESGDERMCDDCIAYAGSDQ